jgi:hypothetical protein
MDTTLWIALGLAVGAVVLYLLTLLGFYLRSRELDQQVDRSKLKPWVDDEK